MAERKNGPSAVMESGPQLSDIRYNKFKTDFPQVPMDEYRVELVECLLNNQNAVIIGETGSGKTTRISDFLLESFPQAKIAITQPRRVAARSVARYVASRRGEQIGDEVGYQVRFEDRTTEGTRANFMTDGILLRKLQFDPLLEEYNVVMVDEAHERSLNIDFVLGLLKHVQAERKNQGMKELKVIVTSATIEKEKFANYFGDSPIVEVPGRMYPVDVYHEQEPIHNYARFAAQKVKDIVTGGERGDILIFMPGEEEIRRTIEEINSLNLPDIDVMSLFGAMAPEDQDKIFEKNPKRKVIIATNIAETSVTIDGVRFVIDSGLIKQKEFNPSTGIEALLVKRHAQSGCEQRKGRAGRTASGTCYRLYPEADYKSRDVYQTPEIVRSNLDHVILAMKKIGIEDVRSFDFIDPPKEEAISQAIETLKMLGALDANEKLTKIGETMSELPLRPEIARMVIEAEKYHCTGKICTIAAMMGEKSVFVRPKGKEREADEAHQQFNKGGSDFLKLLEVWQQWSAAGFNDSWARERYLNVRQLFEVREIRSQLMRELRRQKIVVDDFNGNDPIAIQKCVASGMIQHLLIYSGRHAYERVIRGANSDSSRIFIHPSSTSFSQSPQLMIGADVVTTSKTFTRRCQPVEAEWLPEIAPQLLEEGAKSLRYDPESDSIVENVSYSLRSHYGTIAEQERETTDETVAVEQFAKALAEGKVDLPSVRHNLDTVSALRALYTRSGGQVNVPELMAWYKEHAGGARSKKEVKYIDEQLQLNFNDYCSPERKTEIDRLYPETIEIYGHLLKVAYEYRPANEHSYYESERNEKFKATITIPGDIIFKLNYADLPTLGNGQILEISYRCGDGYNALVSSDLEALKIAVDNKRLENLWSSFSKPEIELAEVESLQPLPSLESVGAVPIVYADNYQGEAVFAYPAYYAETTYNYQMSEYVYKFKIIYYRTETEAKQHQEQVLSIKEKEIAKARRKIDCETLLVPAQEKYATMRPTIEQLSNNYSNYGLDFDDYSRLRDKWREVTYALEGSDVDPKKASELMAEIETTLADILQERERRIVLIPEVQARLDEVAQKVDKIHYDNYNHFGLSYEQYNTISSKYREAIKALQAEDWNGRPLLPDPESAMKIIKWLTEMIPEEPVRQDFYNYSRLERQPYRNSMEISTEKFGTSMFASSVRKSSTKPESKPTKPAPAVVPVAREISKSVEKENMTEELRATLLGHLVTARYFLEVVRSVPEPDKKAVNADKISKARVRAVELKRDLNEIERELAVTTDSARIRGRVAEIVKKADRVAEEISRLQKVREDWTDRYKEFMLKLTEIAKVQEVVLDDAIFSQIRPKVEELAKRKGEVTDLAGEVESIIIDSI